MNEKKDEVMRYYEGRRINKYILEKKIPSEESVFIVGDLNVDKINNEKEIKHFSTIMNAKSQK